MGFFPPAVVRAPNHFPVAVSQSSGRRSGVAWEGRELSRAVRVAACRELRLRGLASGASSGALRHQARALRSTAENVRPGPTHEVT